MSHPCPARSLAALALAAVGLIHCGEDAPADPGPSPDFAVGVASTTAMASGVTRTAFVSGDEVDLLGIDGEARPIVVVGGEVRVLRGDALERRRLFAGPGDPVFLGQIRALRPRASGGAWLAADAGLFVVDAQYVLPVAANIGPLADVREVASGPLAGLWLVTPNALLLALADEVARFEIPDLLGPQRAFAIDAAGRRGVLVAGPEVLLIEPSALDLDIYGLAFDPGPPVAVAATATTLWLATETGLFALDAAGPIDGWSRVDLPSGPIRARTLDADASELHVRDEAGQVLAVSRSGDTFTAERLEGVGDGPLAADGRGGVWIARGTAADLRIEGLRLDAAPRFERDVRPFVETHCAQCHANAGADYRTYEAFAPRAEAALARIRSGDMPRCENDQPCPEDRRLQPADYQVLEGWIEEGLLR